MAKETPLALGRTGTQGPSGVAVTPVNVKLDLREGKPDAELRSAEVRE